MPTNTKALQVAEPAPVVAGKNYIINGGMDIWQRGTSFTTAVQTSPYSMAADRWSIIRDSGTTYAASRQTSAPDGFQYCARFGRPNSDSNTSGVYFGSAFETAVSQQLSGKTVTVSFYARKGSSFSASGSTLTFVLNCSTTQEMGMWGGGTTSTPINSNFTLTTTWQRFTATGTVPSGNLGNKIFFLYTPVGTTTDANDYVEITGVQLEVGSVATPFSRAGGTIQGELAACQRYYYRLTSNAAYGVLASNALAYDTGQMTVFVSFPSQMRIVPTAIDTSATSTFAFDRGNTGAGNTPTSIAIDTTTNQNIGIYTLNKTSTFTANVPYRVYANNSSTAYVGFTAEL